VCILHVVNVCVQIVMCALDSNFSYVCKILCVLFTQLNFQFFSYVCANYVRPFFYGSVPTRMPGSFCWAWLLFLWHRVIGKTKVSLRKRWHNIALPAVAPFNLRCMIVGAYYNVEWILPIVFEEYSFPILRQIIRFRFLINNCARI